MRMLRRVAGLAIVAHVLVPGDSARADTYPRQDRVDVIEYVFRLALDDETDSIEGLATIDLLISDPGREPISFDLVGRSGKRPGGMTVHAVWVAGSDNKAALGPAPAGGERGEVREFVHAGDRLTVPLPAMTLGDARLRITIAYSGIPATGLEIGNNKHGDRCFFSENWPDRARHWLPTIDHPYDKARCQMVVTAPDHYQVISNGLLVEETDLADGRRRTHWRQSVPIATWLFVLGVARFAVQNLADFDGKPVQTWVYPQDRDAGFHDFATPTHDVLEFYSRKVGPFSYEKLANVQSNSVGGGMESATAIFYDDDSVTGERSVRWRNVVIHEIAHHWFGNAVTESDWDDVWLSEGFATYFTLLYREHAYGRDDFVAGLRDARERVWSFYEKHPDYRVIHDSLADMSKVTTGMQYQKGAWTLHMLRVQVGTEVFWDGIREYYAAYRDRNASTADFRGVMERVSGQDLGWFFDQWLSRGGVPRIEGSWSFDRDAVSLRLVQAEAAEVFRLPLTVGLRFADGSVRLESIEMLDREQEFSIASGKRPVEVEIDPRTESLVRSSLSRKEDGR